MTRLAQNPFFVLELGPEATAMDVERKTQRLLAELELGRTAAARYPSPFGEFPRDAEAVRQAARALRDPLRRAEHARWVPPRALWPEPAAVTAAAAAPQSFPELRQLLVGHPLGSDDP
jgi:hypothetical protein